MPAELDLVITLHRPAYQTISSPQQAYVLLEAVPNAAIPATIGGNSVNFSLVLDRSGSMAGDKLLQMKTAAKAVVDRLGPNDMLSLVVFDDVSSTIVPAGTVQDREGIKRKIDGVDERGGTHMSAGMQSGLQELQKGLTPGLVSRMLLLTDGQTWEDQQKCEALADQCRTFGIPINVMGLGVGNENNWDPRFLENIAQRSGGDWTVIDTPDKVSNVFAGIVQSMQGTSVSNASLTMRFVEGITARAVWRVTPLISRLGHQVVASHDIQVFLGDIQQGPGQSILVDLLLPPRPQAGSFRLIQADITYDVPGSGLTGQRVTANVIVAFTDNAAQSNQTNPRVMNLAERVVAHKLQTQALDEAAAGDMPKATQRLRAAATRLLELGESDLAEQANQQAQQMEQGGQIDPAAAQVMRYKTKKLTENLQP